MEYASRVQKGTIFERRDRNGNVWRATVTKRTALYVYVTIENPYNGSVETCDRVVIHQKHANGEPIDDYYIIVHRYIGSRKCDMGFDLARFC